ncbi:MAG: hypothetical protein ACHQQ3_14280, partial [Gemmatimonadales bacterium]
VDLSGKRVYNTARYIGVSGLEWTSPDFRWRVRAAGNWVGPYSPFDEPGVVLGAYGLLHLSAGVRLGDATFDLGLRNVLDRRYPEIVAGHLVAPGEPRAVTGGVKMTF